jgi:hypothetical protein
MRAAEISWESAATQEFEIRKHTQGKKGDTQVNEAE